MFTKQNKNNGFTLAEVLTTLMVIGIVAALTIPNLVNNYKKQTTVTKLKKAYSQLSQAVRKIPEVADCTQGDFECSKFLETGTGNITSKEKVELLAKAFNGSSAKEITPTGAAGNLCKYGFDTADGMGYCMIIPMLNMFAVDINGLENEPNEFNQDRFNFLIASSTKNGVEIGTVIPYGSKLHAQYNGNTNYYWNSDTCSLAECKKTTTTYSSVCSGQIIETGKFPY